MFSFTAALERFIDCHRDIETNLKILKQVLRLKANRCKHVVQKLLFFFSSRSGLGESAATPNQCDQNNGLSFQFWPFTTMKLRPKAKFCCQSRFEILPNKP